MSRHLLGPARRYGRRHHAQCSCGLDVYGRSLPALWEAHQRHLDATRKACENRHPSRRQP